MATLNEIHDLVSDLAAAYEPERVILFGSHARGEAREDSDVDLLVELDLWDTPLRVAAQIAERLAPHFPLDLLARSSQDIRRRYCEGDPLIREALDCGQVLYERDSSRVAGQVGGRSADRPARVRG